MEIDSNQSYWHSLKVVVHKLSIKPLDASECAQLKRALGEVVWYLWVVVLRITVILLYPISIFVLTAVARVNHRHVLKAQEERLRRRNAVPQGMSQQLDEEF